MHGIVVILMGPPGVGKGTHAAPLSQELGLPHISTGDLFREHIRGASPLGIKAKGYIDKGHLVPDALVLDMLFDRVSLTDCQNGYILDGFPRTIAQAQALDERLNGSYRIIAINFSLPDATIIERITGRMICKGCNRPYHKTFDPPKLEMICDACESDLFQRDDDREEIICKRLAVYYHQTQPLIDYYTKQQEVLHEIDSRNGKERVFRDVLDVMTLKV
jgi:adenylate kinase